MFTVFAEIFRFECRTQLRSPLFIVVAVSFFVLAFLAMASDNITIGGGTTNLDFNAPFTIVQSHFVLSVVAMFASVAFVAAPLTRDRELKTEATLVATGVPRLSFLFGRLGGGVVFATLVPCAAVLGTLVGSFMPWLDQERIGDFQVAPYWFSVWAVMVPNMLIIGGLVAAVAALTRSMPASYTVLVALIIAVVVVQANTDQETISRMALADPFGLVAVADVTRYWTVFEKNSLVPSMTGALLLNRLLWLGVAACAVAFGAWGFRMTPKLTRAKAKRTARKPKPPAREVSTRPIAPSFGGALVLHQVWSQCRMDVAGVLRSVPFYVLLLFGMLNVVGAFFGAIAENFGTPVLPLTRTMLAVVEGSYIFVAFVIIVYYAGELVHRERDTGVAEIVDATPYPNGVFVTAKILALWFIVATLLTVVMLASIAVQAGHGYFNFEPLRYLMGLFVINGWTLWMLCVLAVCIQSIVSNKFLGMLILIVLFLGIGAMNSMGFEHVLYQFGVPGARLSDMNGWGHFVEPIVTVGAYWSAWMLIVAVAAHLFMRRGRTDDWRARVDVAATRFTPVVRGVAAAAAIAVVGLGAWIFYNTNVLNEYQTTKDREALQADYEKRYKQYETMPRPEAVDIDVDVDIFPCERRIESRGVATLVNGRDAAIDEVHLSIPLLLTINDVRVGESTLIEADAERGYYRYALNEPLLPGAVMTAHWDLSWRNPGFVNSKSSTRVVGNGTFVDSTEIMPFIGYDPAHELVDNNERRKHELPPVQRLPKYAEAPIDSPNQFGVHHHIQFHAVVSTSADQIAIAPGYLQSERHDGNRRYFEYEMDAPIWPFFSVLSARYAVVRDHWRDVELAVFYHPAHAFNVQRMIEASKKSLDYFTREFGPYQHKQFRILEFPAYASFAQSFPNTIPYSESIGFVADLSDPKHIDYVFYVTAHEFAHQWWGHQEVGRYAQGETLLVETLAQYSALMVMEHEYGAARMRRFLKYELDSYLSNRGGELIEELPLKLVEDQGYIHYSKGSLAMYALKDAIGEEAVNRALRNFLTRYGGVETGFPMSGDLIDLFRAEAPADKQALITALFEKITLWDLRVTDAVVEETVDGKYRVTIQVATQQFEADGAGAEHVVPLDVWLDVALFGEADEGLGEDDLPTPLLIEKQHFGGDSATLQFVVERRPVRVGIDPYNKLIDRNPDDNLFMVPHGN